MLADRNCSDSTWNDLNAVGILNGVGTWMAFFLENNLFISDKDYSQTTTNEQIGSESGGNLVIRYNEFDYDSIPGGNTINCTPIMTHGNGDGGCQDVYWEIDDTTNKCRRRGEPIVEIYSNVMHGKRMDQIINCRGSSNLIHDNSVTGGNLLYNPAISFSEEEYSSPLALKKRTFWPAEDQVFNTFVWNNTYRGHDFNDSVFGNVYSIPNDSLAGLWKNRDYFLHRPQASGGYEYYTGKGGASNTYPTDGKTYPTFGTLHWSPNGANAYFGDTTYTYPHPLRKPPKPKDIGLKN
jgi:hypothetical protein